MNYHRLTPRARLGTTGVSVEYDLAAGETCVLFPPDRVATITIATHWEAGKDAHAIIETTCNSADNVQAALDDKAGARAVYWDNVYGENFQLSTQGSITVCNAVTAIRVTSVRRDEDTNAADTINVCFVG